MRFLSSAISILSVPNTNVIYLYSFGLTASEACNIDEIQDSGIDIRCPAVYPSSAGIPAEPIF
jgi:hypothetical protein